MCFLHFAALLLAAFPIFSERILLKFTDSVNFIPPWDEV